MAVNIFNIKKWYLMLTGRSILHVDQSIGKYFSVNEVKGYYNDLTEKVIREPQLLDSVDLPKVKTEKGEFIEFPTAIFQYGLGAYDLFIKSGDHRYLEKMRQCAEWAIQNQASNGAWNNFFYIYPNHPYCAMAQGEGASLLVRSYLELNVPEYLLTAKRALSFMLRDVNSGGVSVYKDNELVLMEYTHLPVVLNGWIFAIWGLYDFLKVEENKEFREAYEKTVKTLANKVEYFKLPFWSKYDIKGMVASPFYHHLHIAQMEAMYALTKEACFKKYADRWLKQERNVFCKSLAFVIKVYQKVLEKE